MVKRQFYIFTPGKLRRKDNTVFFIPFEEFGEHDDENLQNEILLSVESDGKETDSKMKKVIPINNIEAFHILTESSFNTKFLDFCSKHKIPIHYYNYYGFYSGSFYPREYLLSGSLMIKQVNHYQRKNKRLKLAKLIIKGAAYNISRNLKYYNSRHRDLQTQIDTIENLTTTIDNANSIQELMGIEGNIRKVYYSGFSEILGKEYEKFSRRFHPPDNPINALISFANSMVYTSVLSEIYRTQLNPTISFLHEPSERRYSLALDISEIFKPIFADRLIFKMLNNKQIQSKDFESRLNGFYIKPKARKKFVAEFEKKMETTIKHRQLGKNISYRRLIRLECYKTIKHLIGEKEFEPFKIWW